MNSWAGMPLRNIPPLKLGGHGFDSPSGLTSPRSPTCAPLSSNSHSGNRSIRVSASFNGSSAQLERRERQKKNHYALLGVSCDASHEDIRMAYRKLALQFHPDVVQMECSNSIFCQINGAYDTLSDPHKRKAYDEGLQLGAAKLDSDRTSRMGFSSPDTSSKLYSDRPSMEFSSPVSSSRGRNWETDQCWCS